MGEPNQGDHDANLKDRLDHLDAEFNNMNVIIVFTIITFDHEIEITVAIITMVETVSRRPPA